MIWKDLLKKASTARTMERARKCLGRKTIYKLGTGGIDPTTSSLTKSCDCSGFVAWAIGIPRELPPGSGKWLSTDQYWAGGGHVGHGLFTRVSVAEAMPGDLYVYPDSHGNQGHIGIVTVVRNGKPDKMIHCSSGGWKSFGEAVRETDCVHFANHPNSRIVRPDYDALRKLFGLTASLDTGDTVASGKVPRLIVGKWDGTPPDPYEYRAFPQAKWTGDHFEVSPAEMAAWLGKTAPNATSAPLSQLLAGWKLDFRPEMAHKADPIDPRVYVFVDEEELTEPATTTPAPTPTLKHSILRKTAALSKIVIDNTSLSASGTHVDGVGEVQDALNHLAHAYKELFIDFGANKGAFGPKTEKVVMAFQASHGLSASGKLDKATILALDAALISYDANGMVDKTRAQPAPVNDQQKFIRAYATAAVASMQQWGVPASVTLAQAILESNWGKSKLTLQAQNFFGIKARNGEQAYPIATTEYKNGKPFTVVAKFRKYEDAEECFKAHGQLLATRKWSNGKLIYEKAMANKSDYRKFAEALEGIYATDPTYGDKLIGLIEKYDLHQYDA
ncbi:MAG TPA: glucosaminidase domain-containing protein [Fimbriimonas sp.]|nr:glucosaminidase domain-containing protein [Fimbriimonas sp.]